MSGPVEPVRRRRDGVAAVFGVVRQQGPGRRRDDETDEREPRERRPSRPVAASPPAVDVDGHVDLTA